MTQSAEAGTWESGTGGLEYRVIGPPGCGKTTYLGDQVKRAVEAGRKMSVVSLTKAAAAEVSGRSLPLDSDSVGTLHSMCYRALGHPDIAESRKNLEDWNERNPAFELTISTGGRDRDVEEDQIEAPQEMSRGDPLMNAYQSHRATMGGAMPEDLREFAAVWAAWKDKNGLMDFTELIETCLREVDRAVDDPDAIFVDEAQDMSPLEMALLRKWGEAAGRLVVVGDPDQAIYTWRGADPESFTNPRLPEEQMRILAQSYRLPVEVHAQATRWINPTGNREQIKYLPRDEPGEARRISATYRYPERAIRDAEQYLQDGKKVMLLTTCAYMLQPVVDFLRANGIPFHNPHRRSNGAWNPLQRRRNQVGAQDRLLAFLGMQERGMWTVEDLRRWTEVVRTKGAMVKGGKKLVSELENEESGEAAWEDIYRVLTEEAVEAGLTGDLEWYREQLTTSRRPAAEFPINIARRYGGDKLRETPQIITGTVHSAKGAEADVVYLFPDLSHPGNREWNGNSRQQAGIRRIFYVGMTRARESLILCNPVNSYSSVHFPSTAPRR